MVFSKESEYLIHLISCAISKEKPEEKPSNLSFAEVYRLGIVHDVANIAFYAVEKLINKPEDELYSKWQTKKNLTISRDFNQAFAREEIIDSFKKNNIESVEVQGTEVKKIYPSPEYRTMSDIDFIIKLEDLEKAKEILCSLGYECSIVDGVEVDGHRVPNIWVEIHTEYFPEDSKYSNALPSPFSDGDEDKISIFYAYNILHVAKHYFGRGCGIRRVLDVYLLKKKYGDIIDHKFVESVYEKVEIVDFVKEISELADCWFSGKATPDYLKWMEDFLLESNLHGTDRNFVYNRLHESYGDNAKFARTRYFLRMLFPKRSVLCKSYPILKKSALLYPFCLVPRLFSKLFNTKKRKNVIRDIKNIIKSNSDDRI